VSRFLFAPEDSIVIVGQDGLVANVAKYLNGQLVIGINPEPERNPGVLVRHNLERGLAILLEPTRARIGELATVCAMSDMDEQLIGLNEIFVGQPGHQSARYLLKTPSGQERQSSSGVVVGTGTGATGWLASLAHDRGVAELPALTDQDLAWFVREAWPSPTTGIGLTSGCLQPGEQLTLRVESDELIVFGDGIESDFLRLTWGQSVTIDRGPMAVRLAL